MLDFLYSNLGRIFGAEEITKVQWKLGNDLPPTFIAFILVGALVFVIWSPFREAIPSRRFFLVFLRLCGILILLLVLLQPQVNFEFEEKGVSRVYVLLDRSESMTIKDDGQESRWEKAVKAFSGSSDGCLLYTSPSPRDIS